MSGWGRLVRQGGRSGRPPGTVSYRLLLRRGLVLAGAGLVLVGAVQLFAARRAGERGQHELLDAERALQGADAATAGRHLARADSAFASVSAYAHSPVLRPLGRVPLIGSPVRALVAAGRAGSDAVGAGRSLTRTVASLPIGGLFNVEGGDLGPLRTALVRAENDLDAASRRLRSARLHLRGPAGAALPFVSGPAARAAGRVDASLTSLQRARGVTDLVVRLTDPSADLRLLLLAQDTLELRATGGFIGSFGVIRLHSGRVELERYDSYEALPDPQPALEPPSAMRPWLPRPWGLSNVNWWPDFPTTAGAAREAFARQGGGRVDGVVAITENVLRDLLAAVGPLRLPGFHSPVVAKGLEDRIVYEVELKEPKDVPRKRFLIELADVMFDRLFDAQPSEVPKISRALDRAVTAGDIQVWFADRQNQATLAGTVAAGQLPVTRRDFLLLVDTNRSASKANKELTREVTYRVRRTDDGDHVGRLDITYRNAGESSTVNPWYYGYLRVYVPRGARLLGGSSKGVADRGQADDGPYRVFVADLFVRPLTSETIRIEYRLPESVAAGGRYHLTWLRQAGTSRDRLTAMAGGRTWTAESDRRTLEVAADLRGNPIAEFFRSRKVVQAVFGE